MEKRKRLSHCAVASKVSQRVNLGQIPQESLEAMHITFQSHSSARNESQVPIRKEKHVNKSLYLYDVR